MPTKPDEQGQDRRETAIQDPLYPAAADRAVGNRRGSWARARRRSWRSIATRIEPEVDLDALDLGDAAMRSLRALAERVSGSHAAGVRWRRSHRRRQHLALVVGATAPLRRSAAEAIAHALGRELYCCDVPSLLENWSSESAPSLEALLDTAIEGGGVVLLDGAEALHSAEPCPRQLTRVDGSDSESPPNAAGGESAEGASRRGPATASTGGPDRRALEASDPMASGQYHLEARRQLAADGSSEASGQPPVSGGGESASSVAPAPPGGGRRRRVELFVEVLRTFPGCALFASTSPDRFDAGLARAFESIVELGPPPAGLD